jgi:hypothetical protein
MLMPEKNNFFSLKTKTCYFIEVAGFLSKIKSKFSSISGLMWFHPAVHPKEVFVFL